jgi:hypothetical protein
MRKKRVVPSSVDAVVPREILDKAKRAVHPDRLPIAARCVVCGAQCASNSAEHLCWVCRRLKISAWHESEQQMPAQE